MLKVISQKWIVPQTPPKNTSKNKPLPPLSNNERGKHLRTLHKSLTNEWKLNGPEVRRVFLNRDETQAPKMKQAFVSIDEKRVELSENEKGAATKHKMNRYEQIHKLQSALQKRIMAHKYNETPSVVYISQLKAIQQLMDYLNGQLARDKMMEGRRKLEGKRERIRRYRQKEKEKNPRIDRMDYPNCYQGWYFWGFG